MKISILVDQPGGWIMPWAQCLAGELAGLGHAVIIVHSQQDLPGGDLSFFLGCTRIVKEAYLARNPLNVVVHPSDLPRGRGFSSLAWQLLEGRNDIPVCLFAATPGMDEGPVYLRDVIRLDGGELNDEIKRKQGRTVVDLCLRFVKDFNSLKPQPQTGEATFYPRRTALDSRLDPDKTLREQFQLLRVVDNERYPAFFVLDGRTYLFKIEKAPAGKLEPGP